MKRYIDKFIRYLRIEKEASVHTIRNYTTDLSVFAEFLKDKKIEEVDYLTLRKFLAYISTPVIRFRKANDRYTICGPVSPIKPPGSLCIQ